MISKKDQPSLLLRFSFALEMSVDNFPQVDGRFLAIVKSFHPLLHILFFF